MVDRAIEIIIVAVLLVISLVNFILRGVAYFNFARLNKSKHPSFAFVPFLQYYLFGRVCDDINKKNSKDTEYGVVFLISGVLFGIPSILSCFFSDLPLFTFNLINRQLLMLNYLLWIFEVIYVFCYLICLKMVFESFRSWNFSSFVLFRK